MQAGALHRSCADAGVFARLHQDFEDPTKRTRSFALKWRSGKEPQIGAEEDGPGDAVAAGMFPSQLQNSFHCDPFVTNLRK
eukprot:g30337.t1